MSAVPKKKLCWNCEGNVSQEINNCPYCGVYLQSMESEEENLLWNSSYHSSKTEDIPLPPYQASFIESLAEQRQSVKTRFEFSLKAFLQLKKDILPTLLLMMGSLFFLFGTILFLFASEGTLTLQWKGDQWIYFILISIPSIYFGWRHLQQTEADEEGE